MLLIPLAIAFWREGALDGIDRDRLESEGELIPERNFANLIAYSFARLG